MKIELIELVKELKGIELAKARFNSILIELKGLYNDKRQFDLMLGNKIDEISKSSSINLVNVFNKLLGKNTKVLELQKQEYLRITLEFNEIIKSIEVLEFEKAVIENKIEKEIEIQRSLQKLFNKFNAEIEDKNLKELRDVFNSIEYNSKLIKEIDEAINACSDSITLINSAKNYLSGGIPKERLKGISIEMILDKSFFDMVKLQDLISRVKFKLKEYESEMIDIYKHLELNTIDSQKYSDNFSKLFREVVLLDWQKENSLANSIDFLENYKSSMEENRKYLRKDRTKINRELTTLNNMKNKLLKQ